MLVPFIGCGGSSPPSDTSKYTGQRPDSLNTKITWGRLDEYGTPNGSARPLSSWDHDRRCLEDYIAPRIGHRTLASIQLHDLDDLMATLTKKDGVLTPLSGHTKESITGTLKRMFKLAERRGIVPTNPAARLPTSWGGQSEDRRAIVPSLADVERLAAAAEERAEGCGDVIRLIACTGMRWEEFSALPVPLVDWDDRSLLVEWTATHELRHVAASMFIAGELRPDQIAEIMGHANADYTKRVYGHLFPRDGRPLAQRLTDAYAALAAEEKKLALLKEERELRRAIQRDQAS